MTAYRNLTEFESAALSASVNLSDGHARQSLPPSAAEMLGNIVSEAVLHRIDAIHSQELFLDTLGRITRQRYSSCGLIAYSASIALDIAAKYLSQKVRNVGIVEPTFDNLEALLRHAGLQSIPIPEAAIFPGVDFAFLDKACIEALFVVIPSNPTSRTLEKTQILALIDWAASRQCTLVIDLSFRLFDPALCWDMISAAESAGASLMTIDDTGKSISLFDTKVGILSTTEDIAPEVRLIHSDILLNVSSLDLTMLTAILDPSSTGEVSRAVDIVRSNRKSLREALRGSVLAGFVGISADAESAVSVEWVKLGTDRDFVYEQCARLGLEILPGDHFYWSQRAGGSTGAQFVRIALLRDVDYFVSGVRILLDALSDCVQKKPKEQA